MVSQVVYRSETGEVIAARAQGKSENPAADQTDLQVIQTAGGIDLLVGLVARVVRGKENDPVWIGEIKNLMVESIHSSTSQDLADVLRQSVQTANQALTTNPTLRGNGLTLLVFAIQGSRLFLGQVGNSRAYLIRDEQALQLTHDHSMGNDLLRLGRTLPENLSPAPGQPDLIRYVGKDRNVFVDTQIYISGAEGKNYLDLRPGDGILIAADGTLDRLIRDENLLNESFFTFYEQQTPEIVADRMLQVVQDRQPEVSHSLILLRVLGQRVAATAPIRATTVVSQLGVISSILVLSIILGLAAAYGIPVLMNPKEVPNPTKPPPQAGFISVAAADGIAQYILPGQNPVNMAVGTLIEARPGIQFRTGQGTAKIQISDGTAVYIDINTNITLSEIANPKSQKLNSNLILSKGGIMVDVSHTGTGSTALVNAGSPVNANVNGQFIGVDVNPGEHRLDADCMEGDCRLSGSTASRVMNTGQHSWVIDGVIGDVNETRWGRWAQLCDSDCPVQEAQIPITGPKLLPTPVAPVPYLGAFHFNDLFSNLVGYQSAKTKPVRSGPFQPISSFAGFFALILLGMGALQVSRVLYHGRWKIESKSRSGPVNQ